MSEAPNSQIAVTVHYNGSCPVCSREIRHYRGLQSDGDIAWCDITREPEQIGDFGVGLNAAKRRLHLVVGGKLVSGVDAFAILWDRLPRYRWLSRLVRSRIGRPVAVALYEGLIAPALYGWNRLNGR